MEGRLGGNRSSKECLDIGGEGREQTWPPRPAFPQPRSQVEAGGGCAAAKVAKQQRCTVDTYMSRMEYLEGRIQPSNRRCPSHSVPSKKLQQLHEPEKEWDGWRKRPTGEKSSAQTDVRRGLCGMPT